MSVKNKTLSIHKATYASNDNLFVGKKLPQAWSKNYYKEYPRFENLRLPTRCLNDNPNLDIFYKRASLRSFKNSPLSIELISQLLYFSAGLKLDAKGVSRRMYPSAGARYPLEVYMIVLNNCPQLQKGIYHYNVKHHSLENLLEKDVRSQLMGIVGKHNQNLIQNAPLLFVVSAVFGRTEVKYGERSYRFIINECGHLAQNMYLVSEILHLGCCEIGGFNDNQINSLLRFDPEIEQVLSLVAFGN